MKCRSQHVECTEDAQHSCLVARVSFCGTQVLSSRVRAVIVVWRPSIMAAEALLIVKDSDMSHLHIADVHDGNKHAIK